MRDLHDIRFARTSFRATFLKRGLIVARKELYWVPRSSKLRVRSISLIGCPLAINSLLQEQRDRVGR